MKSIGLFVLVVASVYTLPSFAEERFCFVKKDIYYPAVDCGELPVDHCLRRAGYVKCGALEPSSDERAAPPSPEDVAAPEDPEALTRPEEVVVAEPPSPAPVAAPAPNQKPESIKRLAEERAREKERRAGILRAFYKSARVKGRYCKKGSRYYAAKRKKCFGREVNYCKKRGGFVPCDDKLYIDRIYERTIPQDAFEAVSLRENKKRLWEKKHPNAPFEAPVPVKAQAKEVREGPLASQIHPAYAAKCAHLKKDFNVCQSGRKPDVECVPIRQRFFKCLESVDGIKIDGYPAARKEIDCSSASEAGSAFACAMCNCRYEAEVEKTNDAYTWVNRTVVTRALSDYYPNSVCKVVYQKSQYEWTAKRKRHNNIETDEDYNKCLRPTLAALAYRDEKGPTHFHGTYIAPGWRKGCKHMKTIEQHAYYQECKGGKTGRVRPDKLIRLRSALNSMDMTGVEQ